MTGNIFTLPPGTPGEEFLETLAARPGCRIERILSRGHASSPGFWYDQQEDEWVLLVSGSARLELRDPARTVSLAPGDWILLPAGCRHRVAATAADTDTIWLAVFMEGKKHEKF